MNDELKSLEREENTSAPQTEETTEAEVAEAVETAQVPTEETKTAAETAETPSEGDEMTAAEPKTETTEPEMEAAVHTEAEEAPAPASPAEPAKPASPTRPIYAQAVPVQTPKTAYTASATWQGGAPTQPPKKEKKKGKGGRVIAKIASVLALAVLFGVVSSAVFLGITDLHMDGNGSAAQNGDGIKGDNMSASEGADRDMVSVADAMKDAFDRAGMAEREQYTVAQINIIMEPAMVSITAVGETYVQSFFGTSVYPTQSSGSGIIVGENDTEVLVATNNHVVANSKEIKVQFADGSEVAALIKGTDAKNDLAVIAVKREDITLKTMDAIAYATLGDSDALVIGEGVVAVGNALGFGQSVTDGIVSALNRAVEDSEGNVSYMIQTNAAINPGNSGGALVNMQGQVIGINSAKYADEAVEGMGFAIPINTALPILEDLMVRTTRTEVTDAEKAAYLGITPQDVTAAMRDMYGWPVGVYVSDVVKGSCADRAGLVKGDIITLFDGESVASTAALRKTLSYYEAGETVEITVERYERGTFETLTVEITLDKRPAEE